MNEAVQSVPEAEVAGAVGIPWDHARLLAERYGVERVRRALAARTC